jgi:sensor c-di-GMP phosphodiesterase-like protein
MKFRLPSVVQTAIVVASVAAFATTGHFAADAVIQAQQTRQLDELVNVALRRSEAAVDFGTATLDDLAARGAPGCDPASLQAVRLQVYQRYAVKDIRIVTRDGSVACSAYAETLEFDNGWAERADMLPSQDKRVLMFRVDQINGVALAVLKDVDPTRSLVAILGIDSSLFDIMPAGLRASSDVALELSNGAEVGQFAQKPRDAFANALRFTKASSRYPIRATVRVERAALRTWNSDIALPMTIVAIALGLVFGLLLTRATAKTGPVADIDQGLARREFKPFYQPTFDLRTGAIIGCEVLARWIKQDGSIVPPMNFIPVAETSGRIERMTWQLLETALDELRPRLKSDKAFKLSINITKISARQVVLEVTERTELPDLDKAAAVVRALRELGFRVAMDDVGVGHSGLSQMKALGANTIKIDKFFIDTVTQDGSSAIVELLVRLARDLQMTVIAEGIETEDQVQTLIACGVEEGQGYFVSPPLPFAKFDALVEARRVKADAEATVQAAAMVA